MAITTHDARTKGALGKNSVIGLGKNPGNHNEGGGVSCLEVQGPRFSHLLLLLRCGRGSGDAVYIYPRPRCNLRGVFFIGYTTLPMSRSSRKHPRACGPGPRRWPSNSTSVQTGVEKGIGQDGQMVESSFFVDRPGDVHHGRGEPGWINDGWAKGVPHNVTDQCGLLLFGGGQRRVSRAGFARRSLASWDGRRDA